jgi:hypothetical protein
MDLTPGERAVMNQLRDLYAKTSARDHPLTRIAAQWPPIHYEAYRKALAGLLEKDLLDNPNSGQAVRLTDAGLKALGFDASTAASRAKSTAADTRSHTAPRKPVTAKPVPETTARKARAKRKPLAAVLGGLGSVAVLAGLGWLLWRGF